MRSAIVAVAVLWSALAVPAGAQPVPALNEQELALVYEEAVQTHNGLLYTFDYAILRECRNAAALERQLATPPNRMTPLARLLRVAHAANRPLFAMEPAMREAIRVLLTRGERTPLVRLAGGDCMMIELRATNPGAVPGLAQLRDELPRLVALGFLPRPERLHNEPALVSRTLAFRMRGPEQIAAAPPAFDFNQTLANGQTMLTRAVLSGQWESMRALLSRGADPNRCAPLSCPIAYAVRTPDEAEARAAVDALLAAGARPDALPAASRRSALALATAIYDGRRALAERLLAAGANPDGVKGEGPPLHAAAAASRMDLIDLLLAKGADLNLRDHSAPLPYSAYDVAVEGKDSAFAAALERRMVDAASASGRYAATFWIEQAGRRIALPQPEVRLERAPFRIVARFSGEAAMIVATATSDFLVRGMESRTDDTALNRSTTVSAEATDGKSDWLLVNANPGGRGDAGLQFWFWRDDNDRRFTRRRQAGGVEYVREIAAVKREAENGDYVDLPIEKLPDAMLHLVLGAHYPLSVMQHRLIQPQAVRLRFD